MTYVLPSPVRLQGDESLMSLVFRNACRFHFRSPARVLQRARPPRLLLSEVCRQDTGGDFAGRMRDLLGLSDAEMTRASLWHADADTMSLLGVPMRKELVRTTMRQVCPECLRNSPHHRAVWFLDVLPVCAVHRSWLLLSCPRCEKPLRWRGPGVHRCSDPACGFDLRQAKASEHKAEHMPAVRGLHRVLHDGTDGMRLPPGVPAGELFHLAFVLGHFSQGKDRVAQPSSYCLKQRADVPAMIQAGWAALDDWPSGFHELLVRLRSRSGERPYGVGLRKEFGALLNRLGSWSKLDWGESIGNAFAEHVAGLPDIATTEARLREYGRNADLSGRHLSTNEAARRLNIASPTMLRVAAAKKMYVVPSRGIGSVSSVHIDVVRRLEAEARDGINIDETKKLLGVSRALLEKFIDAEWVTVIPTDERFIESKLFRRSSIETLSSLLCAGAVAMTESRAVELGMWNQQAIITSGRSVLGLCAAILHGHLRAAASAGRYGVAGLRFQPDEVRAAMPLAKTTMSATEVAKVLSTHHNNVLAWAKKGLMRTVEPEERKTFREKGLRFDDACVRDFQARYFVAGLDAQGDKHPRDLWMTRHLLFLGLKPVLVPEVDGFFSTVFLRADCTPEVLAAVEDLRAGPVVETRVRRRRGYDRVLLAAKAVSRVWGCPLTRTNNRFSNEAGVRAVQVMSGSRPDMTGVFLFTVHQGSLAALQRCEEPYLALVPSEGEAFLLVPLQQVKWRGRADETGSRQITLRLDARGMDESMRPFLVQFIPYAL